VLFVVVIAIIIRFQRESALGLDEKPDRIACHPTLWPLEGQHVMDVSGEHLQEIG
jgi:hypothetical protein